MKTLFKAKVTGQDPVHKHVYSVCFKNKGYYFNSKTGSVSTFVTTSCKSFQKVNVKTAYIVEAITEAVKSRLSE